MIQIWIGILFSLGVFFLLLDLAKAPYLKTSQAVESIAKKQKNKTSALEIWLQGLAGFLARYIRMNDFRKEALAEQLKAARIDKTPEEYQADAIVKAMLITAVSLLGGIFLKILIPFSFLLGFVLYKIEMKKADKQIRRKREEIEFELPRLVFTISRTMTSSFSILFFKS